jgi:YbbR domain-containing protein
MKGILRRVFLENLGLKLVALALSFVLFLYVQGERRRDTVTGALVKLSLLAPRGKVLTIDPVDKLAVTLRGPRSAVQRLMSEGIAQVEIDLQGRAPGPLHFTSEMIQVPRGLTVESIQPPQIDVSWEDRVVKVVPLLARYGGKPAAGYRVARIVVSPREAEVEGAKSAIESLQAIELSEVRVDGRDRNAEFTLAVQPNRKFVFVRPDRATVRVEITAEVVTRQFSAIPVELVHPPADLEVEVSPRSARRVVVEGPAAALGQIDRSQLRAVIDLRELGSIQPGSYQRPVRMENLPPGARVLATTPPSFALVVRRKARGPDEGGNR